LSITTKNFVYSTFIGLEVEIINSSQRDLIGLKGRIVDETKNTIVIEVNGKEKKIQKNSCTFRFYLEDGTADVDGSRITFRHFERPKKVKKDAIIKTQKISQV